MSFQMGNPRNARVPRVVTLDLADSQAFKVGALVVKDTDGLCAECAADPDMVGGIALAPCGTDSSGFNILATLEFPPGKMQVEALEADSVLTCEYVGDLPAADGGSYGAIKDTDGKWKLDFNETTAALFVLVGRRTDSPENIARVVVKPIPSIIQSI